jgi:hypothetical protein
MNDQGYIPVTMYNKAVFPQQYVSGTCTCASGGFILLVLCCASLLYQLAFYIEVWLSCPPNTAAVLGALNT